ncbi:MAG: hypothetical protein FJY67_09310 [Calditrichaeota bacterium]|nr:hypothetical protein [Calditrichota bacterium]
MLALRYHRNAAILRQGVASKMLALSYHRNAAILAAGRCQKDAGATLSRFKITPFTAFLT